MLGKLQDAWEYSARKANCIPQELDENEDTEERVMAPAASQSLRLVNGNTIPVIGFGVYLTKPGPVTHNAVSSALKAGYRHIDTAAYYRNESDVGKAVRDSKIPRSDIFVTTKLWLSDWGYKSALKGVSTSLENLGLDYIDLMLLHAPGDPDLRSETWKALEECQTQGMIKSIGVSNFGIAHLEKLAKTQTIAPCVNQIEIHPFLQRKQLVDYCRSKNIIVTAYSPLAKAQKLQHPVIVEVAHRNGLTPAQLMIKWSLQKGYIPLPKSIKPERIRENMEALHAPDLGQHDLQLLDSLDEEMVTGWDPITQHDV